MDKERRGGMAGEEEDDLAEWLSVRRSSHSAWRLERYVVIW